MKRYRLLAAVLLVLAAASARGADAPARAEEQCVWTGVERIVAVGDVHGDFGQFVKALRAAGVIDEKNEWIGGKTHLVQTGDVPDRGPDTRKAMDLLMKLETQAAKAGGRVHALIGNHEAMLMTVDLRYVHPGEMESFDGREGLVKAFSPEGTYGKWILGHNAVIKINDILFLHGGIGPEYAEEPLADMNGAIREALEKGERSSTGALMDPGGPLWYRGLALNSGKVLDSVVDPVLAYHKAKRIVIGHTVSKGGIRVNGGKVIVIDVGMSAVYAGPAECLLVEKNEYFAVSPDSKRKLDLPRGK